MLPRSWMEAYVRFLLGHRYVVVALIAAVTLVLGYYLRHTQIYINFVDLSPQTIPTCNSTASTAVCLAQRMCSLSPWR